MDRVKISQRYLNGLPRPTDMPDVPWIQWRVENVDEMYRFLEDEIVNKFNVRLRMLRIPGDQILIQTAVLNSDLQISPGDCLVITEFNGLPRLGVVRAKSSVPIREADGLKDHSGTEFLQPNDNRVTHSIITPETIRRSQR